MWSQIKSVDWQNMPAINGSQYFDLANIDKQTSGTNGPQIAAETLLREATGFEDALVFERAGSEVTCRFGRVNAQIAAPVKRNNDYRIFDKPIIGKGTDEKTSAFNFLRKMAIPQAEAEDHNQSVMHDPPQAGQSPELQYPDLVDIEHTHVLVTDPSTRSIKRFKVTCG